MPISETERAFLEEHYLISTPDSEMNEEEILTEEIIGAIDAVLNNPDRKMGPKRIIRIERLLKTIEGREDQPFLLKELAEEFSSTSNPRKSAANFISWLNQQFEEIGLDIEIASKRKTLYIFRER